MTSRNQIVRALLLLACFAGCGNYSNEDLEYMNALPEREDLQADLPTRSAIAPADRAELYRLTHGVTTAFNGAVDAFLGIVDAIRTYSPTTRGTNFRIWGPFPAEKHPGWEARMVVERQSDKTTFAYRVEFRPAGAGAWVPLITGSFLAAGGVRKGEGHLEVTTVPLRDLGFDPDLGYLNQMKVDYQTATFPISVVVMLTNFDDPNDDNDIWEATYDYAAQQNGQAALNFDYSAMFIEGPLGLEKTNVTSRWLGSGDGRSDLTIIEGDGAGATFAECWNDQFLETYADRSWTDLGDRGVSSLCPDIPVLTRM